MGKSTISLAIFYTLLFWELLYPRILNSFATTAQALMTPREYLGSDISFPANLWIYFRRRSLDPEECD